MEENSKLWVWKTPLVYILQILLLQDKEYEGSKMLDQLPLEQSVPSKMDSSFVFSYTGRI